MKKPLACVLAPGLLVGALAGCSNSGQGGGSAATPTPSAAQPANSDAPSTPPENPPSGDALKVDVFYYNFSDVYISSVRSAMDERLTALGADFNNYDAAGSQPTQTDQVNTALVQSPDLLIVNIVETSSPDAAQGICDAAKAAGIPIIFFNREVADSVVSSYEKCAFVGTNAPDAGHMQGEMIGDFLLANYDAYDLNKDGAISYVMFKGQEGNAEAEARTQFAVEDANTKLTGAGKPELVYYDTAASTKYLVDQNGQWSAQAATDYMNSILATYTESNNNMVELVIANNDEMAKGAISALQSVGYNNGEGTTTIPVFGVDAIADAKTLISEGKMSGSIMQDAVGMADTIVALVKNVQAGGALMDKIDAGSGYVVDQGVAKIRVPYQMYNG